jgi:mannose-1-phosphate guanylyltransferase
VLGDTDRVIVQDAEGVVVSTGGRLVAVLGLDDIVVVDTPDALLVTTRKHVQDVKSLVERLRAQGHTDLA